MIQPHDYAIEINADEEGVFVNVRHKPSGFELRARPKPAESVGAARDRLIAQLESKFYPDEDFELSHHQICRDGVRGGSWGVVHLPTGIRRSANTFDEPATLRMGFGKLFNRLKRDVVAEIWRLKNGESNL